MMKRYGFMIMILGCLAGTTYAGKLVTLTHKTGEGGQPKHLFILSGQSNMQHLHPKLSFIPAVEQEFGKEAVIVVQCAFGGTQIRRWYPDWKDDRPRKTRGARPRYKEPAGDLYAIMKAEVDKAIAGETIASVTFVWMQGESDALLYPGEVYEGNLRGLLALVAKDTGREQINFVIGRLSDNKNKRQYWNEIREVQVKVAESSPRGAWVDTDDLNDLDPSDPRYETHNNGVHYSPAGFRMLGKRFAEKAITLIHAAGNGKAQSSTEPAK